MTIKIDSNVKITLSKDSEYPFYEILIIAGKIAHINRRDDGYGECTKTLYSKFQDILHKKAELLKIFKKMLENIPEDEISQVLLYSSEAYVPTIEEVKLEAARDKINAAHQRYNDAKAKFDILKRELAAAEEELYNDYY